MSAMQLPFDFLPLGPTARRRLRGGLVALSLALNAGKGVHPVSAIVPGLFDLIVFERRPAGGSEVFRSLAP